MKNVYKKERKYEGGRGLGPGPRRWGRQAAPHFHLPISRSLRSLPWAHARAGAARVQARGRAGAQWCGWCVGANPGRQAQRKEPSVLMQRALTQRAAAASSHSLTSAEGKTAAATPALRAEGAGARRASGWSARLAPAARGGVSPAGGGAPRAAAWFLGWVR